ncbi:Protein kinase domain-containing protein [Plasmodiophora brassicae]|uniref:Protein kinase domain-containing protein n=1 Tax=Plasmodiophora brassicae TaxID=37360 RepID=A0A0G4ITF6_PLABS|nr:hypothetical protein PBRA_006664 [Plasmodiophora brassicae]SPQ95822.1 unnamed protein product [Plasmodiophora brassicae]
MATFAGAWLIFSVALAACAKAWLPGKVEHDALARRSVYRLVHPVRILGSGHCGTVCLGKHWKTGQLGAVKFFTPRYRSHIYDAPVKRHRLNEDILWKRAKKTFLAEHAAMQGLGAVNHENVIKMLGSVVQEGDNISPVYAIVYEYANAGTLHDLLQSATPVRLRVALSLLAQLTSAVRAVHSKGITHGDLHAKNVLLHSASGSPTDPGVRAILADFGEGDDDEMTLDTESLKKVYVEVLNRVDMVHLCCQLVANFTNLGPDNLRSLSASLSYKSNISHAAKEPSNGYMSTPSV